MSLPYLPSNKSWSDITREERYFCSELYHEFKSNPSELVKILNKKSSLKLDEGDDWELGFEVCFYRDLLKAFGKGIKAVNKDLDENHRLPQKRTFDLCLFSAQEVIIIEAKSQAGLTEDQLKDFKKEKERLNRLFDFIEKEQQQPFGRPKVRLVILASSKYLNSNRSLLGRKQSDSEDLWSSVFYGKVSWAELADSVQCEKLKSVFMRADGLCGK